MRTGVIDYNAGNLQSVLNALKAVGREAHLVTCPAETADLDAVIFPGQGHFGDCATNLRNAGLWDFVRDWVAADKPFFGICVGYQLLFEGSEESPGIPGLGAFPGQVVRFPQSPGLKVPHMGWNTATVSDPSDPFWQGIPAAPHFYFVHSYFPVPVNPQIAGCNTTYGETNFASGLVSGNIVATQFHPEKSQSLGLRLLDNFFTRAALQTTAS